MAWDYFFDVPVVGQAPTAISVVQSGSLFVYVKPQVGVSV